MIIYFIPQDRIREIEHYLNLGFSLEESLSFFSMGKDGQRICGEKNSNNDKKPTLSIVTDE